MLGQAATGLAVDGPDRLVSTTDGSQVAARAVVIASGGSWRRLGVPRLEALVGSGVFYGATGAEAQAMRGLEVYVVGAGNSAGQAALHLARYAHLVTMLVRGDSVAASMSDYLTTEIDETPNVDVRLRTEVVYGGGRATWGPSSCARRIRTAPRPCPHPHCSSSLVPSHIPNGFQAA